MVRFTRVRFGRYLALVGAAMTSLLLMMPSGAQADPSAPPVYGPVQNNWLQAFLYSVGNPDVLPQGMNDFGCTPSVAHPNPVVLVNGTLENMYANWSMYSPQLKADGYCVFGLNYGGAEGSPIQQLGNMRASGLELSRFVDQVLASTGASKVDLVGHSQGGLLPLFYINRLGGEGKVGTMVGVEPATQGIGLYGILDWVSSNPVTTAIVGIPLAAGIDFTEHSAFMQDVAEGGLTRPTVRYVTVHSRNDLLIQLPEAQLPPGPNVTNVVTQDVCPEDQADHVTAVYDDITLRLVRNALDPATAQPPRCHPVYPIINQSPGQP